MKVRCKIDNFKAIKNNELLTVIRETEDDFVIEKDGMEWYCDKRYFDIVEESKQEPKITPIDELKEYCKSEIKKEQESIYQHETIIIARNQVIKAYEDILKRIGEQNGKRTIHQRK